MTVKAQYSFKVFWKSTLDRMVAADRQQRIKVCEECHNLYCTQIYIFIWVNSHYWARGLEIEERTVFCLGNWGGRENCGELIINGDNSNTDFMNIRTENFQWI
jgi:hypothetical protein